MRRPLAAASLLFVAAVRLTTLLFPLPVREPEYGDGQTAVYTGEVSQIVCSTDSVTGEAAYIIYLKNAISEGSDLTSRSENGYDLICRPGSGEPLPELGSHACYEGNVRHFRQATNPGEFDAKAYYNRQGYSFEIRDARLVGKGEGYSLPAQMLYRLKEHMGEALDILLPMREASVAKAMLLGEKKGMDRELKSLYQAAGISHILAISGLHVSLLGMGVYRMLSRLLGKQAGCICACVFLASYLCMTGFSPSSLRAGIMFGFAMAARLLERTYDPATALAVAAALLLVEDPAYLEDVGFGLSFSAAVGAVALVPAFGRMEGGRPRCPERGVDGGDGGMGRLWGLALRRMQTGFRASLCISLATLPLLLSAYYEWNMLSILLNLVVVPLMGILLGGCILLATAGGILLAIGPELLFLLKPFALPVRAILWLYEGSCRLESRAGIGLWRTGRPQTWQILLYCAGLLCLALCARKLSRVAGYGAAWLLCLVFLIDPFRGGQFTMLDVGQGDCIYIRTEEGRHYLYDGGSSSKRDVGTWQIIPFLKYQGVDRLEMIFVSHWDGDHISGVSEILEWAGEGNLELGGLTLPAGGPEDEAFLELVDKALANGIPVYRMKAGDEIRDGSSRFLALHPMDGEEIPDRNEGSLVLRYSVENRTREPFSARGESFSAGGESFSAGGESFSALLTGDIGVRGEERMMQEHGGAIGPCGVLKTAHHGSDTSSGEAFLDRISPCVALISCGRDNSYGHPHEAVLERFRDRKIPVFVTAEAGALTVRYKGDRMWVEPFLDID